MGTTSTEDIENLRKEIQHTKAELMHTAGELEGRVEHIRDWKGAVRHYPMRALGISLLAGFALAWVIPSLGHTVRHAALSGGQALGRSIQTAVMAALVTEARKRMGQI